MRSVRSRNTGPEILVRRAAHSMGLRFRLHQASLPGTPDIVFPKFRTVVFVHGCFWHRHIGCRKAGTPKVSSGFWTAKFHRNVARDRQVQTALRQLGWRVIVLWQCQVATERAAVTLLKRAFGAGRVATQSRRVGPKGMAS